MKNSNLFLLMAAVFALASCGTYTHTAQQGGAQFRNSIYYTPGNTNSQEYIQEQQYIAKLQEKTGEAMQNGQTQTYDASTNTMTVQVGDNNVVDIEYNPNVTYQIVDDQESYEARLRKFDSPTYTINIEMATSPWWGYDWRSTWYGRHYSLYRPLRGWYGSWYSPWYYPWYGAWNSPWYADYAWGFYDPFYDPFYNPWWNHYYGPGFYYPSWHLGYYPGHHYPHHPGLHPGHGPGAPSHGHGKDVHYGKRNDTPSYKDVRKGNSGTMASGAAAHKPTTGSVTRRPQSATQDKNINATQNKQGSVNNNPDKKQTTTTNRNHNSNSSNKGSYTRTTSSQQTRSNSSSYSQSSGYSGGRSSGATHSSGGGSSYRRR